VLLLARLQHDGSVVQMLKLLAPVFPPQYQSMLGVWLTAGLSFT
jgi:hypothetical protein